MHDIEAPRALSETVKTGALRGAGARIVCAKAVYLALITLAQREKRHAAVVE